MADVLLTYYIDPNPARGSDTTGDGTLEAPFQTLDHLWINVLAADVSDPIYYTLARPSAGTPTDVVRLRVRIFGGEVLLTRTLRTAEDYFQVVLQGVENAQLLFTALPGSTKLLRCDGPSAGILLGRAGFLLQNLRIDCDGRSLENEDSSAINCAIAHCAGAGLLTAINITTGTQGVGGSQFIKDCSYGNTVAVGSTSVAVNPSVWLGEGKGALLPQPTRSPNASMGDLADNFDYAPTRFVNLAAVTAACAAVSGGGIIPTVTDSFADWINDASAAVALAPETVIAATIDLVNNRISLTGDRVVARVVSPYLGPYPAIFRSYSFFMPAQEDVTIAGFKGVVDANNSNAERTIEVRYTPFIPGGLALYDPLPELALINGAVDFRPMLRGGLSTPVTGVGFTTPHMFVQFRVTLRTNGA